LSIEEGWRDQQSGIDFFNRMLSVNLLKDGEVINIHYDFHPEKRCIEENRLGEQHKKPQLPDYTGTSFINITHTKLSTFTSRKIPQLSPGACVLRVTAQGYKEVEKRIVLKGVDPTVAKPRTVLIHLGKE